MVDVICDTSFLIHFATKRIKNIDSLDVEIGQIRFVVPSVVITELEKLCNNPKKNQDALATLNFSKKLKKLPISGNFADESLINFSKENQCIIATLDKELKKKIKNAGGSIITFSNDRIILEPSKNLTWRDKNELIWLH